MLSERLRARLDDLAARSTELEQRLQDPEVASMIQSGAVSPSPVPFSGSLLITESIHQVGSGSRSSVTVTCRSMSTIL